MSIRSRSRADEMRAVFARWRESGQSLRAFGKQEGVSYAKLLYWRQKLEGEPKTSPESTLVAVEVVADEPAKKPGAAKFDVWLTNGMSLEVQPGFDAAELRRLVGVLQSC